MKNKSSHTQLNSFFLTHDANFKKDFIENVPKWIIKTNLSRYVMWLEFLVLFNFYALSQIFTLSSQLYPEITVKGKVCLTIVVLYDLFYYKKENVYSDNITLYEKYSPCWLISCWITFVFVQRWWKHGFQGGNGESMENCRKSILSDS